MLDPEVGLRSTLTLVALLLGLAPPTAAADAGSPRVVEITARRFAFEPARIDVPLGTRVQLKLRSADVDHGLTIKAYKVKLLAPRGGEWVTAEFTASQAGTFPISCSEYCGTGHGRMKAQLVVTPPQP